MFGLLFQIRFGIIQLPCQNNPYSHKHLIIIEIDMNYKFYKFKIIRHIRREKNRSGENKSISG
jgi:hypothetical protein